tara:strand:+ start:198 stop:389 length:192 start_codon:yes stop_codon:yes gene_type:complete
MFEMDAQEVTIMVQSNIDPAQLLDIVQEMCQQLSSEVEDHGYPCVVHTEEVSVEYKGQLEGGK